MFFAVFLEYRFAEDEEGFEVLEDLELLDFVILEVWGGFEEVFRDFEEKLLQALRNKMETRD